MWLAKLGHHMINNTKNLVMTPRIRNRNSLRTNFEQYIVLEKDLTFINDSPKLVYSFPFEADETEIIKNDGKFAFPVDTKETSGNIEHFTYVRIDTDGKWLFGYCRQQCEVKTNSAISTIFLSYIPYAEKIFYRILDTSTNNNVSLLPDTDTEAMNSILQQLYQCTSTTASLTPVMTRVNNESLSSSEVNNENIQTNPIVPQLMFPLPNNAVLPSTLDNRCLSDFYNFFTPKSMILIFASLLAERRIVVTSSKLSRLSSISVACNAILYPCHWQHIFVPVLPVTMSDCLDAPMPFIIGVQDAVFYQWRQGSHTPTEYVHIDTDTDTVTSPFPQDLKSLPTGLISKLKKRLVKNEATGNDLARSFLKVFVKLLGKYEAGFTKMERIDFDTARFIRHSKASRRSFLKHVFTHSQMFQQFVQERTPILVDLGSGVISSMSIEPDIFQTALEAKNKGEKQKRRKAIASYCSSAEPISLHPMEHSHPEETKVSKTSFYAKIPLRRQLPEPFRAITSDPNLCRRWSLVATELSSKFENQSIENIGHPNSFKGDGEAITRQKVGIFDEPSSDDDVFDLDLPPLSLPYTISDSDSSPLLERSLNDADVNLLRQYGLEKFFICNSSNNKMKH